MLKMLLREMTHRKILSNRSLLKTFLSLFLFILLIDSGCLDRGVEPPQPSKNLRDYIWTLQEISDPRFQVLATNVWGSSPQNVYVTFVSGSVRTYKLFHFDGSQRSEVDVGQFGSSQVGFDLYAINGFSPTDAWAAGAREYSNQNAPPNYLDSTLIIHFNGSTWRHFTGSEVPTFFGSYTRVAIHSRLVVAVGDYERGKAVALIGKR